MRRRLLLFGAILTMTGMFINTSYSLFGTETYTKTVVLVPCSLSGSGGVSGEITPGGGGASVTGSGTVVYAHYKGKVKSCPGWAWGCFDYGAVPEITDTTPTQPCPNRETRPDEVVHHT